MIGRREFITLLGGAVAGWPVIVRAQQTGKLPTIGFLGADASSWSSWTAAFVQRLRELGWIEGRTIAIEYRWNEGRHERIAEIATEFVHLKVNVIVTNAIAVPTLMQATEVIPIVFSTRGRPGRRRCGRKFGATRRECHRTVNPVDRYAGKRLELLREVLPRLRRLAVIGNVGFPQAVLEMDEVHAVARALGIEVAPLGIRRTEDIAPAFEALKPPADALYVVGDALVNTNRTRIMTFSLSARLPTIWNDHVFVQSGGLMSYGPNRSDRFRRAAELVDKILRGTKPAIFRSSSRPDSSLSSILRRPGHLA